MLFWAGNYQIWTPDNGEVHNYLVHTESVDQFIGSEDKNDKEVYEGDVVQPFHVDKKPVELAVIKYMQMDFTWCKIKMTNLWIAFGSIILK